MTANRTLARLERILLLVPWLLEHPGADVYEVTDRFDLTREELSDDLDVLGYCGLPGYGGGDLVEASIVGDRVTVRMADFFRRPLRLSVREAVTLLLAAHALAGIEGFPESADLRRAVDKLEAALGGSPAGGPPARVAIDLRTPGDEHLPILRTAVEAGEVVHLVYRSASKAETTSRDVEPWALVGWRGSWYLQAWCRLARAPRDFRLDRMRAVRPTGERGARARPAEQPGPAYVPAPDDPVVVLDLGPAVWWVEEWAVVDAIEERGDVHRVTLRTAEPDWIARLVLRVGTGARVVAPAVLAERVGALAREALDRYEPRGS